MARKILTPHVATLSQITCDACGKEALTTDQTPANWLAVYHYREAPDGKPYGNVDGSYDLCGGCAKHVAKAFPRDKRPNWA